MIIERVAMKHSGTKAEIQVPVTAIKVYERSGWALVEEKDTTDSPASPAPAGKTRAAKEESK